MIRLIHSLKTRKFQKKILLFPLSRWITFEQFQTWYYDFLLELKFQKVLSGIFYPFAQCSCILSKFIIPQITSKWSDFKIEVGWGSPYLKYHISRCISNHLTNDQIFLLAGHKVDFISTCEANISLLWPPSREKKTCLTREKNYFYSCFY